MKLTDKQIDKDLVLLCREGQTSAFAELVKRWHQKLCRQAYFHTKDLDLSKDIAQDCWTVIYTKLDQLQNAENFGSWALSIANRKAIDALRKQARRAQQLRSLNRGNQASDPTEESSMELTEVNSNQMLLKAIKNLPNPQQQVIRLFYVEEYNLLEISELLKVSKGTVKSRLFYAREKLKQIIKNKDHEE